MPKLEWISNGEGRDPLLLGINKRTWNNIFKGVRKWQRNPNSDAKFSPHCQNLIDNGKAAVMLSFTQAVIKQTVSEILKNVPESDILKMRCINKGHIDSFRVLIGKYPVRKQQAIDNAIALLSKQGYTIIQPENNIEDKLSVVEMAEILTRKLSKEELSELVRMFDDGSFEDVMYSHLLKTDFENFPEKYASD